MKTQIISACALILLATSCNKRDAPGPCVTGCPCIETAQAQNLNHDKPQLQERLTDTTQGVPGRKPPPHTQR